MADYFTHFSCLFAFSMSVPLKMRRGRKHSIANWWRTWITKKGSIPASKCRWTPRAAPARYGSIATTVVIPTT
jgi:hypothetical protein